VSLNKNQLKCWHSNFICCLETK